MVVVVQGLAVHGDDGREGQLAAAGQGDALDPAGDLPFVDAGLGHGHGFAVHGGADGQGRLDLLDLLRALQRALGDHRLDELDRGVVFDRLGADAQQLFQPQGVLAAVGGQEVDLAPLAHGLLQHFAQIGQRPRVGDADPGAAAFQRRLRAHPDDVLHLQVVAEDRLPVLVDVDDRGQAGKIQAEEIEERAVLAVMVGVGRVVHRALAVAQEKQQPRLHLLCQFGSSLLVDFFVEHGVSCKKTSYASAEIKSRGVRLTREAKSGKMYFCECPLSANKIPNGENGKETLFGHRRHGFLRPGQACLEQRFFGQDLF